MAAFIIVDTDSGTVTFSDEVLAEFPEITGEVNGNVVRISNVWREDLIDLVGGNIYWTKKQPFASFSIIFDENNKTSVDTLSNLLVRYVNYHDGDYEISLPKYSSDVSVLYDPLGLDVRPNYYGELQKYIDGETTIEALAEAIYKLYVIALPDYPDWRPSDDTLGGPDEIQAAISAIPEEDIRKFLASNESAVSLFDVVKSEGQPSSIYRTNKYYLSTSKEEIGLEVSGRHNINGGPYNITTLCTSSDDISPVTEAVHGRSEVITHCLLKRMRWQDFNIDRVVKIRSYFGAEATLEKESLYAYSNEYYRFDIKISYSRYGVHPVLLGEFIADILSTVEIPTIASNSSYSPAIVIFRRPATEYGGPGCARYDLSDGTLSVNSDTLSLAFAVAKSRLDNIADDVVSGENTLKIEKRINFSNVNYCSHMNCAGYPPCADELVEMASGLSTPKHTMQYCMKFGNLNLLRANDTHWYEYNNGHFTISGKDQLGFIGTPIGQKVTSVTVYEKSSAQSDPNQPLIVDETRDIYAALIINGFVDISYFDGSKSYYGGKFFLNGRDDFRARETIEALMWAGVKYFDRIYPDNHNIGYHELDLSLRYDFAVDEVFPGNLLVAKFSKELPSGTGYFESGYDSGRLGSSTSRAFFRRAISSVTLNGVPLTDISGISKVIASDDRLAAYSPYKVRDEDMEFFHTLFTTLRNGYRTIFRHTAEDSTAIGDDENSYAYSTLTKILSTLFSVSASSDNAQDTYDKLSALANGGYVTVSQAGPESHLIGTGSVAYDVYLTKIERQLRTITYPDGDYPNAGRIRIESDDSTGEDKVVDFEAGDPYAKYSPPALVGYEKNGLRFTFRFLQKSTGALDGNTVTRQWEQTYDLKNMSVGTEYHEYQGDVDPTWEGEIPVTPASTTISKGKRVIYTPVDNGDGSVTISYQVLDEDDNDITDLFNTLTIGETFLHKELL